MSKVVVLVGGGFLGRAAVRSFLASGIRVIAPGSRETDLLRREGVAAVESEFDRETTVVLAAALTRDRGDDASAYDANMAMVRHVAEAVARRPVALLAYLSSTAVYGHRATDLNVTERTAPDPDSWYARSKVDGEALVRGSGSPASILRICQVYGPEDPHPTYGPAAFIQGIRRERAVTLFGDGEELRDHLFVDDAGALIARLTSARATGVLNLATGVSTSFREIAERLGRVAGGPIEIRSKPRRVSLTHQAFDVARLRAAAPDVVFTGLDEGLRRSWEVDNAGRGESS